jgi:hypothetical protein
VNLRKDHYPHLIKSPYKENLHEGWIGRAPRKRHTLVVLDPQQRNLSRYLGTQKENVGVLQHKHGFRILNPWGKSRVSN